MAAQITSLKAQLLAALTMAGRTARHDRANDLVVYDLPTPGWLERVVRLLGLDDAR